MFRSLGILASKENYRLSCLGPLVFLLQKTNYRLSCLGPLVFLLQKTNYRLSCLGPLVFLLQKTNYRLSCLGTLVFLLQKINYRLSCLGPLVFLLHYSPHLSLSQQNANQCFVTTHCRPILKYNFLTNNKFMKRCWGIKNFSFLNKI